MKSSRRIDAARAAAAATALVALVVLAVVPIPLHLPAHRLVALLAVVLVAGGMDRILKRRYVEQTAKTDVEELGAV